MRWLAPLACALALAACGGGPAAGGSANAGASTDAAGLPDASPPPPDAGGPADAGSQAPADAAAELDASSGADAQTPIGRVCVPLTNGGAEAGDLSGWELEVGQAAAAGAADGVAPAEGAYAFSIGASVPSSVGRDVPLEAYADLLATGRLVAHLAAETRLSSIGDRSFLELTALDASGSSLGGAASVPLQTSFWMRRQRSLALPPQTRALRIAMRATGNAGAGNRAFFDAFELCLDGEPPAADERLLNGPSLTWLTPDAVTISWELPAGSPAAQVVYGPTAALGSSATASVDGTHQKVRLTGLPADTVQHYRVDHGGEAGALHAVQTAPTSSRPFSFVAWGDNQDGPEVFHPLVKQMAALHPEFMLSLGDQVQVGLEPLYHEQLLLPLSPMGATVPHVAVPGNHNVGSDWTLAQFDLHIPQPSHCWGWRYGDAYFLLMGSEAELAVSQDCLDRARRESASAALRIAALHFPPRIEYWAGGQTDGMEAVRYYVEPQLIAAGFHLALTGHSHVYTWGPPEGTGGVTWVTSGGGGGGLETPADLVRDWPEITEARFRHHFLHATWDGARLTVRAIADTGEVLHEFEVP